MSKNIRNKKTIFSTSLFCTGMEGFYQITIPDDREETFLYYEILSNSFTNEEEKSIAIENLHLLIRTYPNIGDLHALLVIGYRGLEMHNRAKSILRKSSVRFPNNLTIKLLSYLYKAPKMSCDLHFTPKTLTQSFIQGSIQIKEAFQITDVDLALAFLEKMINHEEHYHQMGHWALGEAFYTLVLETGLDPLEIKTCNLNSFITSCLIVSS